MAACVTSQRAAKQVSTLSIYPSEFKSEYTDTVVLLHGLVRHAESMEKMSLSLRQAGYRVCNIDYPSRYFPVKALATQFVLPRIQECQQQNTGRLHFVTHSMGGIIVRALSKSLQEEIETSMIGRLVMLSPPSQGSELADLTQNSWLSYQINGPAASELGTTDDSLPNKLLAPVMPFGIIAAKGSNSLMSLFIPGDDDGKVSIERMRLNGMLDFVQVRSTHSFMMQNWEVIEHVLHFLSHENFYHH